MLYSGSCAYERPDLPLSSYLMLACVLSTGRFILEKAKVLKVCCMKDTELPL
mgnify:CR=1 FL=1